ncbi:MAG: DUF5615 family PIN-like protein [Imperialibacter sp.]
MKLLLDENIPRKLKSDLLDFNVFTVREMGWNGKQNGELLRLMLEENFNVLITADKNLQTQQNFTKYPVPVIVLNVVLLTYEHMVPLVPRLKNLLNSQLNNGSTTLSE